MRIIHVWSQYELRDDPDMAVRHKEARKTWTKLYERGGVNTPAEIGVFGKTSRNALLCDSKSDKPCYDAKAFPFVSDVIRLGMLRAQDDDVICLTRADTAFRNIPDPLATHESPSFAQRIVEYGDGDWAHPACDLFAFTKRWWREHQKEWPRFLLGRDPYWWTTMRDLIRKHGGKELEGVISRLPSKREPEPVKPGDGVPVRIAHNEKLARTWAEENAKLPPFISPTHEQVEHWPLNRRGLSLFGYNPSIIRHKGKLLLAYRYHHQGDPATTLAMAELDDKGNVLENGDIHINGVAGSTEDVKLFELNGELCCTFVMSTWPNVPPKSVVKWGKLTKDSSWRISEHWQPNYGQNDGSCMQKGWLGFEYESKLHILYHPQLPPKNEHVVIECNGVEVVQEYRTPSLRWPYGLIKGGTPPIPYKGLWLRFLHGTLDNEPPPFRRRYFITACLMEPKPPFKFLSLIQKPIIRGSEKDDLTGLEKSSCHHHKQQVVYPGGAIKDGNDFLLAYGVNDCACAVARIKESDLKFT